MLIAASVLVCLAGVLLVFGVLPPNRHFGLRTARTLADRQVWDRAHRELGSVLCGLGVLIGVCGRAPDIPVSWAVGIGAILLFMAAFVVVYRRYAA
jgi:uncharacterized membrane protein